MLKKVFDIKYGLIFLILGLIIFFYKYALSGFDLLPGDNIDSRYLNYILEHFWLWINQIEPHKSLWDMPCLYPAKNTLAYSDVLMGLGLIYVPLRFFINAYNAFLCTSIVLCFLNFSSFYYLLRNCFKYKDLSCAVGAFFFAFSLVRYGQMVHVQLFSQCFSIFGLICILKSNKYPLLSFLGCTFVALQFYTSFYLGWFIVFGFFILSIILVFIKDIRQKIFGYLKTHKIFILSNMLFFIILLLPLVIHYLSVGVTKYPYDVVQQLVPTLKYYFINQSFIDNLIIFKFKYLDPDFVYGIGVFTSILLLYSICSLDKYRKIIIIFVIIIYAIINIPILHRLVYDYFPAGGVIRAVGRFINILCPIFAVILANFIENLNKQTIKIIIVILFIIEQIPAQNLFLYSKKEALHDINKYSVPNTCNVIFINYSKIPTEKYILWNKIEIDGVWLALTHRIYSVHGYPSIPMTRKRVDLKPECIIELKD